ncbi:MAG TPA: type II toxin-antitoxin system RelE/ParE family toxin [Tepidisphaeraceae bacterium]|jgi:mRNA-degrading endonuclease RelE of RelBE toxin-antitoxin system
MAASRYRIQFSPDAESHLRALTARQQRTVLENVQDKLTFQPTVQSRNRKQLRPNHLATWELRVGDLRVYYIISSPDFVSIVAVGVKVRDRVYIGGEEFEL